MTTDQESPLEECYPPSRCETIRLLRSEGAQAADVLENVQQYGFLSDKSAAMEAFEECRNLIEANCCFEDRPLPENELIYGAGSDALAAIKRFRDGPDKSEAMKALQSFLTTYEDRRVVEKAAIAEWADEC